MQTTNHILMIRPVDFKFNEQTAGNNKFQQANSASDVQQKALQEFDGFVALLRANGVEVTVINDTLQPETPDSIFPNNWISFHHNGEVILYPMFSVNRRAERRSDIIESLGKTFGISKITDLSTYENSDQFLEGTGSLVLDRDHKIAYACLSLRTNQEVLDDFCEKTGYQAIVFNAVDSTGYPIYHTNVMMCIGDKFAVVCFDSIPDATEQALVRGSLSQSGKEIVSITFDQMNHFAGNMLQVSNKEGESLLVMSEQAYRSLNPNQISALEKYCSLVYAPLYTIETNGGGSARCMLAEVHLPTKP
ncbi:arginine deiminase-related protein [Pedobacter sp. KR3-3]|uniref:Arginine deiminase-related protein n=1 Tax=Pedobacter albus TaxID=3113905 RepID=A0ABU7I3E9_9SPHI|nr:arginine deiminase-related protein [Pedobacter sp. KR3-3]MEE1943958.1 arginine deiminase-related protein [Pedobacter sp. KR3-3]